MQGNDSRRLRSAFWTPLLIGVVLFQVGCDDSPSQPGTMGTLSLSVIGAGAAAKLDAGPQTAAAGVELSRARFLLRRIKFQNALQEEFDFYSSPLVVELDLDGTMNEIDVVAVPAGTYDEVRFDVHRLDPEDPADQVFLAQPEFADFGLPVRPSMIIEGTFDDGTSTTPFEFTSTVNDEQRFQLAEAVVIESGATVNVTLFIDTSAWFADGQGGVLNPFDPGHENQISDNVRASIDVFRDQDRNGRIDE